MGMLESPVSQDCDTQGLRGCSNLHAPPANCRLQGRDRTALDQLDAGAPRIGDVGDRVAGWRLTIRLIELDAFAFDLGNEGLQVLHIKTNVIEHTAERPDLWRVGLGKAELSARN